MTESIKCTECGGNKCQPVSNNTYRCLYCGATFQIKQQETTPTPPQPMYVAPSQPQVIIVQQPAAPQQPATPAFRHNYSKNTACVLAILLGGLGAQWFYLGRAGRGIIYLLFCWTYIPAILSLIQGISFACMNNDDFDRKYNM